MGCCRWSVLRRLCPCLVMRVSPVSRVNRTLPPSGPRQRRTTRSSAATTLTQTCRDTRSCCIYTRAQTHARALKHTHARTTHPPTNNNTRARAHTQTNNTPTNNTHTIHTRTHNTHTHTQIHTHTQNNVNACMMTLTKRMY